MPPSVSAVVLVWPLVKMHRRCCLVAAKVSHMALSSQGQPERKSRVLNMVKTMDEEGS